MPKCQSVEHLYKTSFIFLNITCLSVGFIKIDNASWIFFINYTILSLMSSNVKLVLFCSIIYLSVKFALISCSQVPYDLQIFCFKVLNIVKLFCCFYETCDYVILITFVNICAKQFVNGTNAIQALMIFSPLIKD